MSVSLFVLTHTAPSASTGRSSWQPSELWMLSPIFSTNYIAISATTTTNILSLPVDTHARLNHRIRSAQLPSSLRAVDAVADVFDDSAREVGIRVYGHPGGLTVKERYKLAEKREVFLRNTREQCEAERAILVLRIAACLVFYQHFHYPPQLAEWLSLGGLLVKPWSQVPSPPPRTCIPT